MHMFFKKKIKKNDSEIKNSLESYGSYDAEENYKSFIESLQGYKNPFYLNPNLVSTLYTRYGVVGKIIDVPVDSALSTPPLLYADNIEQKEADIVQSAMLDSSELGGLGLLLDSPWRAIMRTKKNSRLYGGAGIVIGTGADGEFGVPLKIDESLHNKNVTLYPVYLHNSTIMQQLLDQKKGHMWLSRDVQVQSKIQLINDPLFCDKLIDKSRIIVLREEALDAIQGQNTMFGSLSILTRGFDYLSEYLDTSASLFKMYKAKSVLAYGYNQDVVHAHAPETIIEMTLNNIKKNARRLEKGDDIVTNSYLQKPETLNIDFAGLQYAEEALRKRLLMMYDLTEGELLHEQASGFSSGEEGQSMIERRNRRMQSETNNFVKKIFQIIAYDKLGVKLENLDIEYKTTREPTMIEAEDIKFKKMQNLGMAMQNGFLTREEARQIIINSDLFEYNLEESVDE
jgi:hypothetical protein